MVALYAVGIFLSLSLSVGCLVADIIYDDTPRKCIGKFLLHVGLSFVWPVGLPVWLAAVAYTNRWDVL